MTELDTADGIMASREMRDLIPEYFLRLPEAIPVRDAIASALRSAHEAGKREAAEFVRTARETIHSNHDGSPIGDCPRWDNGAEIAAAILSLSPSPTGGLVAVKPLEWRGPYGTTSSAGTIIGGYEVWKHPRNDSWVMQKGFSDTFHPTEEAAKAAAQADYEARIRSALVLPAPPADGEKKLPTAHASDASTWDLDANNGGSARSMGGKFWTEGGGL